MFSIYASNSNSYTHLIIAPGIVREPTIWGFITSEYPGIHDIGRANILSVGGLHGGGGCREAIADQDDAAALQPGRMCTAAGERCSWTRFSLS